jgi:hypothetical protein
MITKVSSQTECSLANKKHRHRLMESIKKGIICGPDSSGVVGLELGGGSCGRNNETKNCRLLRSTCFVNLFS